MQARGWIMRPPYAARQEGDTRHRRAAFLVGVIVIAGGLVYFPMPILGPIGERLAG
jgi:K+-transporting ATPase A subunit